MTYKEKFIEKLQIYNLSKSEDLEHDVIAHLINWAEKGNDFAYNLLRLNFDTAESLIHKFYEWELDKNEVYPMDTELILEMYFIKAKGIAKKSGICIEKIKTTHMHIIFYLIENEFLKLF